MQCRSKGLPPPQSPQKPFSEKAKSVEKLGGGGVYVTCSKLKLIKYVSIVANDEELDAEGT